MLRLCSFRIALGRTVILYLYNMLQYTPGQPFSCPFLRHHSVHGRFIVKYHIPFATILTRPAKHKEVPFPQEHDFVT